VCVCYPGVILDLFVIFLSILLTCNPFIFHFKQKRNGWDEQYTASPTLVLICYMMHSIVTNWDLETESSLFPEWRNYYCQNRAL